MYEYATELNFSLSLGNVSKLPVQYQSYRQCQYTEIYYKTESAYM